MVGQVVLNLKECHYTPISTPSGEEAHLPPPPPDRGMSADHHTSLRRLVQGFSIQDAERIKEIEKVTNHDIKAVEYFLKEKLAEVCPLDLVRKRQRFNRAALTSSKRKAQTSPNR